MHQYGPGQAYVFNYDGDEWVESQMIAPADGVNNQWFGRSVKITDDYIFVGPVKANTTSSVYGAYTVLQLKMANGQTQRLSCKQ